MAETRALLQIIWPNQISLAKAAKVDVFRYTSTKFCCLLLRRIPRKQPALPCIYLLQHPTCQRLPAGGLPLTLQFSSGKVMPHVIDRCLRHFPLWQAEVRNICQNIQASSSHISRRLLSEPHLPRLFCTIDLCLTADSIPYPTYYR